MAPSSPGSALVASAQRFIGEGDLTAAEMACKDALRLDPANAMAMNLLGGIAAQAQALETAVEWLSAAVAVDPLFDSAHANLRIVLVTAGRSGDAIAHFEALTKAHPIYLAGFLNLARLHFAAPNWQVAQAVLTTAVSLEPDSAEAQYLLGEVYRITEQSEPAIATLEIAVRLDPQNAVALNNLGLLYNTKGNTRAAEKYYRLAVAVDPTSKEISSNLASSLAKLGDTAGAKSQYELTLAIDPNYAKARSDYAAVLRSRGDVDAARQQFLSAIELEPNYADAQTNLAVVELSLGLLEQGAERYEWRRQVSTWRSLAPASGIPELTGQPVAGKTLLVYAEQGMGDCVQFVRYVSELHAGGARVLLRCHESLRTLLQSAPGVDAYLGPNDPIPPYDYQIPLMSLLHRMGTNLTNVPADIPYLRAPERLDEQWRDRMKQHAGTKVGVVWGGSPVNQDDGNRSLALACFAELLESPGCHFFSLQKGDPSGQAAPFIEAGVLTDLDSDIRDFADTAAIIASLDLVISVDTSVAHVAGALGKPVWILLSGMPDWRWMLESETSPWYPTARLFRQRTIGEWGGVVQEIEAALRAIVTTQQHTASNA